MYFKLRASVGREKRVHSSEGNEQKTKKKKKWFGINKKWNSEWRMVVWGADYYQLSTPHTERESSSDTCSSVTFVSSRFKVLWEEILPWDLHHLHPQESASVFHLVHFVFLFSAYYLTRMITIYKDRMHSRKSS